jgi:hypothetical protein
MKTTTLFCTFLLIGTLSSLGVQVSAAAFLKTQTASSTQRAGDESDSAFGHRPLPANMTWSCEEFSEVTSKIIYCAGLGSVDYTREIAITRSLLVELGIVGLPWHLDIQDTSRTQYFDYQFGFACQFSDCYSQPPVCQHQTPISSMHYFRAAPTTLLSLSGVSGSADCRRALNSCNVASCTLSFSADPNCLNCPIYFSYRYV